MHIKRSIIAFFSILFAAGALSARAQAVPAATAQRFTLVAGGVGSVFQPDYMGGLIAQTGPKRLYGVGAFVDLKLTRYVQIEAEARWLRFNSYLDITQNNYLIGPRIPIERLRYRRATPYAKVLFGYGEMNLEYNAAWFRSADIAYGGGVDVKLTKKISIRALDFEYQLWPQPYLNRSLLPYGGSVGIGYKIF